MPATGIDVPQEHQRDTEKKSRKNKPLTGTNTAKEMTGHQVSPQDSKHARRSTHPPPGSIFSVIGGVVRLFRQPHHKKRLHQTTESKRKEAQPHRRAVLERAGAEVGHQGARVHGRGEHQGAQQAAASVPEPPSPLLPLLVAVATAVGVNLPAG